MIRVKTNINSVISSLNGKISSFLPGAENYDGLLRTVATSMIGVVKTRIHEQGKAADDNIIGEYSTKPLYIGSSGNPGSKKLFGKPVGKTGKSEFASGKKKGQPHTSKYYSGGYKQFKTEIGRNQLGTVNLSLSGQLNNQLNVQPTSRGYGYGWPDTEKLRRAIGLEKKYRKKIWALTEEERLQVIQISQNYVKRVVSE